MAEEGLGRGLEEEEEEEEEEEGVEGEEEGVEVNLHVVDVGDGGKEEGGDRLLHHLHPLSYPRCCCL